MTNAHHLATLLREARALLARPDNDFDWSSWEDSVHALTEVDALIARLETGDCPPELSISGLFAPTGRMQEVSLSSGWDDAFLDLAARIDAALAAVYR